MNKVIIILREHYILSS